MIRSIKYTIGNFTILGIAKFFVVAVGVGNMILMPTYSSALLLLENQICGFIMFLFILGGLVTAFGALRTDGIDIKKTLFTIVASVATIGFGVYLNMIYIAALGSQASLDVNKYANSFVTVANAVNLATAVSVAYGVGLLAMIFVQVRALKNKTPRIEE